MNFHRYVASMVGTFVMFALEENNPSAIVRQFMTVGVKLYFLFYFPYGLTKTMNHIER